MLCLLVGVIFSGYRAKSDLTLKIHYVPRETSSKTLEKAENTGQKKPILRRFRQFQGKNWLQKALRQRISQLKQKRRAKSSGQ